MLRFQTELRATRAMRSRSPDERPWAGRLLPVDGTRLIGVAVPEGIAVLDTGGDLSATWRQLSVPRGALEVAVAPDGSSLAILTKKELRILDADGKPRARAPLSGAPRALRFDPGGEVLWVGVERDGAQRVLRFGVEKADARGEALVHGRPEAEQTLHPLAGRKLAVEARLMNESKLTLVQENLVPSGSFEAQAPCTYIEVTDPLLTVADVERVAIFRYPNHESAVAEHRWDPSHRFGWAGCRMERWIVVGMAGGERFELFDAGTLAPAGAFTLPGEPIPLQGSRWAGSMTGFRFEILFTKVTKNRLQGEMTWNTGHRAEIRGPRKGNDLSFAEKTLLEGDAATFKLNERKRGTIDGGVMTGNDRGRPFTAIRTSGVRQVVALRSGLLAAVVETETSREVRFFHVHSHVRPENLDQT